MDFTVKTNQRRDFKSKLQRFGRTQRPPRYYLIDFGLSRQYSSQNAIDDPLSGGDTSAPEHQSGRQCNPFQTDIYHLGNLVRERFIKVMVFESLFLRALTGSSRNITASGL